MENENTCHCCKKKDRSDKERKDLMNRLSRIEGQIRGIRGMVEKNAYCTDILTQSLAVSSAIDGFNRELLLSHFNTCVINDIKEDKQESIEEFMKILKKAMR